MATINPKEPKQDSREDIVAKVTELKEKVNEMLVEDEGADPYLASRLNQIMNDTMAAIPPDPPPEPKFQRATLSSTMTKMKEQAEAVIASLSTKPEVADKFKQPFEEAESSAKAEDQTESVAPPAGPSQSPQELQPPPYEQPPV